MKKYFVLIVSLMFSLCASVHGESVNFAEEIIGIHSAGKLKLKGSIEYYDNINFDATKINENGILKISFYPKDERNRFEIKTHVKHGEFAALIQSPKDGQLKTEIGDVIGYIMDRHFLEMPIEVELDNSNVTAGLLIIEFLAESEGNATQYFKHIKRGRLTMKGSKENVLSYLKYGDHPMQGKDEATFDRVYYLWVDGPVTVTIKDRNSTYGGETSIQKGGILNLSKGWNALHRKAVVSFVNGNFQVVSSVILDNPNLKWCSGGWD